MGINRDIRNLVDEDSTISPNCLIYLYNEKDPTHVDRKKQQRAITDEMILVTLYYGTKKRTYKDISYTLTDRCLRSTQYEKYLDKLRGLTIIGRWENNQFQLITSFWNFSVKSKKRF